MKQLLTFVSLLLPGVLFAQQWTISVVGQLPEPVSNNAVCEGFSSEGSFIYSFGGIDSTLLPGGIHRKAWRVNTQTLVVEQLPDVPDTLGKIASAASQVNGIIYIMGGYHVLPGGTEVSSDRVHRFDVALNQFISDGAPIPIPIDDHVQATFRDSLIYVVSGWSNTANVPEVQIYNTYTDSWTIGTATPNNNSYKCFGASGAILGDTLYYFGGAAGFNFGAQSRLRKGAINPADPTQISWSVVEPLPEVRLYRSAACVTPQAVHWLGGSNVSYNFNAIAYNGSGVVSPSQQALYLHPVSALWGVEDLNGLPMDLRGAAEISPTEKYLMGGTGENRTVLNTLLRLDYIGSLSVHDLGQERSGPFLYPNPTRGSVYADGTGWLTIFDTAGKQLVGRQVEHGERIDLQQLPTGLYVARLSNDGRALHQVVAVEH